MLHDDFGLTGVQYAALIAILHGLPDRVAVSEEAALVAAGHTLATLESLTTAGWLTGWFPPDKKGVPGKGAKVYTLTPWGAERAGFELRDAWTSVSGPEERSAEEKAIVREESVVTELARITRRLTAEELAERTARAERRAEIRANRPATVAYVVEVARWVVAEPRPMKGIPKPRRIPVILPDRHRESRMSSWFLPEWAASTPEANWAASTPEPIDELIAREEMEAAEKAAAEKAAAERFLSQEMRAETGEVRMEPVLLFGLPIPIAQPKGRPRRKARMTA